MHAPKPRDLKNRNPQILCFSAEALPPVASRKIRRPASLPAGEQWSGSPEDGDSFSWLSLSWEIQEPPDTPWLPSLRGFTNDQGLGLLGSRAEQEESLGVSLHPVHLSPSGVYRAPPNRGRNPQRCNLEQTALAKPSVRTECSRTCGGGHRSRVRHVGCLVGVSAMISLFEVGRRGKYELVLGMECMSCCTLRGAAIL